MERDDDLVVFAEYYSPVDANLVKGLLESNGIQAGVVGDHYANVLLISPMRVLVKRCDMERAQAIVDSSGALDEAGDAGQQ